MARGGVVGLVSVFWPAGELVSRLWGRRVEQLALPMRPLVARGMDSRVTPIRDRNGDQVAAAWNRTLRGSGRPVFSGAYSARTLPGAGRPSVHVAFPLDSGNVQVFLQSTVTDDGGLLLESPTGRFGQDGAYVVVRDRRAHAARVPLHETFHVYVDADGVLRTDHELRLWSASAVRLHYKLDGSRDPLLPPSPRCPAGWACGRSSRPPAHRDARARPRRVPVPHAAGCSHGLPGPAAGPAARGLRAVA